MKKIIKGIICIGLIFAITGIPGMKVSAEEEENKILAGIYVEDMSL